VGPPKRSKAATQVDDAVGAGFAGVVGEDGKAGLHAGLDEEWLDLEVGLGDARSVASRGGTTDEIAMP